MPSSLRRRGIKDGRRSRSNSVASKEETLLATPQDPDNSEELALVPVSSISKLKDKHGNAKGRKRRNGFIFFLGGLFGIVVAGFFAQQNDLIGLPELGDLNLESFMDVFPAGFLQDARELKVGRGAHSSYALC